MQSSRTILTFQATLLPMYVFNILISAFNIPISAFDILISLFVHSFVCILTEISRPGAQFWRDALTVSPKLRESSRSPE